MSQSTYNTDPSVAVAGQLVERVPNGIMGSYQSSEDLLPGVFVELHTDGKLRVPRGTGADIGKPVGVVMYRAAIEPNGQTGYKAGEYVNCVRRGKVWATLAAGATVAELTDANVSHSSTVATDRGKFTNAAEAAGVGVEIDNVGPGRIKFVRGNLATSPTLALLDLNL